MNARGPVFKYGDNIDTDVIIPARYLNTQSAAELASHCMEDIDKTFVTRVKAGNIMVGGENFGCGSSTSMPPLPSRRPVSAALSPRALPASSTATPSTSVYRFSSAPPPAKQSTRAIQSASTLTPASLPTKPQARPSRPRPSRRLSRTLSPRAA